MSRVLFVQYTNPAGYPPLEHSSRILAGQGCSVCFLGIDVREADDFRFPPHPGIQVRQMSYCPPGWRQKIHFLFYCVWVLVWMLSWRPRWIYASDLFSCPISLLLSWVSGVRVVYHEHDAPGPASSPFMRFVLWTRRKLARRADFCLVPNEERARLFMVETGAVEVLRPWNCPSRDEVLRVPRLIHGTGELSVLYHGSLSPGRLPKALFQAVAMLPVPVRLRVIGYETVGHRGYRLELERLAEDLGIAGRVEFLGALRTRAEVLEWCGNSDVGLALMPVRNPSHNERNMAGASNKAFDCLACGMPLLVSDLPEWRSMFVDPGYGLACDPRDPSSIAYALQWFVDHRKEVREMGDRGRLRTLEEWNYDVQFAPISGRLVGAAALEGSAA